MQNLTFDTKKKYIKILFLRGCATYNIFKQLVVKIFLRYFNLFENRITVLFGIFISQLIYIGNPSA